ncbi:UNVERIFIED_CONTAM: hypothetical protein NY603_31875, partial [Bacteroidetes bacterium 56_B9]
MYIDRQDTDRRLSDQAQDTVLAVLRDLVEADRDVRVEHGHFGQVGVEEQIKTVADADVSLSSPFVIISVYVHREGRD